MKTWTKKLFSCLLAVCLLAIPFTASAEPIDLMPVDDSGYTIVEGDGTVTIEGDKVIFENNTDGDLRIWINNATPFDMIENNAVHMQFEAGMPFKMAFYLISDADATDDWLTTSTDYLDLFELDTATDRSPAGTYDVNMNIRDLAVTIKDASSVHFDQFIILMTGKGTFTLNTVELANVFAPAEDDAGEEVPTEEPEADTEPTQAPDTDTPSDDAGKEEAASFPLIPVIVGAVVLVAAVAVVVIVVKKRKA